MALLLTSGPTELKPFVAESLDRIRRDSSEAERAPGHAVVLAAEGSGRSV